MLRDVNVLRPECVAERSLSSFACFSCTSVSLFCLPTFKIDGIVRTATSFVRGGLRVRAQRPRAINLSACLMRRQDLIGSLSLFHPLIEGRDAIELIRAITALAVIHSWNHEKPNRLRCLRRSAEFVY